MKEVERNQQLIKVEDKLGVKINGGVKYIPINDIVRFQASSNYTFIHILGKKPILISKTLKSFVERLANGFFIRVHQSHLVNLNHVKEFHKKHGSYLVLNNGEKITVSKSNRSLLASVFNYC